MSRKLFDTIRRRRKAESGAIVKDWNDHYHVALIYPNTYHQGMSNLGLQTVYQLINQRDDCLCERFFLPDSDELTEHEKNGSPLVSYESHRPLADFDLIALSISFENDYLNLPTIFDLGGVPLFHHQRSSNDPLVLFGGVCAFLNPAPLFDLVDLVAVGEAEPLLPPLFDILTAGENKHDAPSRLAAVDGIYLPHTHPASRVKRQYLEDLDQSASRSFIQSKESEFGDMALAEVSRGCSRGCRFCAAGYIYLPPRERSLDNLLQQVDIGLCERQKVGLVAAAVADYSSVTDLQQGILQRGGQVSVSSLRLDALTAEDVTELRNSGLRTAAIAPEAGSQRLRDLINKGISEEQILEAVQLLADGDIRNLKLYLLIGLPTEQQADLDEMLDLMEKIRLIWRQAGRRQGQMGTVTLSVNPFIPKPFTPFQWVGMEPENSLKKKLRYLYSAVSRMPNTELNSESVRSAVLQAFLSRGDRKVGSLLPQLAAGGNLKQICKKNGLNLADYVTRARREDDVFPWEVVDQGFSRQYLWQEYQRALRGELTSRCVDGCRRCGICTDD